MKLLFVVRSLMTLFLLGLPGAVLLAQDTRELVIESSRDGSRLVGATIVSKNGDFNLLTDSLGTALIPLRIIEQDIVLEISMVGYKTKTLRSRSLSARSVVQLNADAAVLEEVVVSNYSPIRKVREIQMGTEAVTVQEARKLPAILGEVDIIKLLQLKPGVKSAGEGLAGFYVRGGGADQNLILIDHAPVYNPNHLLGLFSVFNVDAVREVKLFKAAYPARYGGRLSSVLDVSMRPGSYDTLSVSGGIGLLSSRLSVETPIQKGKSSIVVSGRRTYFDVFTNLLNRANRNDSAWEPIPGYFFSDLNIRTDWKLSNTNSMWATGYLGSDNFSSPPSEDFNTTFTWGNRTASLNWRSLSVKKMELLTTVFYSRYQYVLSNEFDQNSIALRSGISTTGFKFIANTRSTGAWQMNTGIDGMIHRLEIGDFRASSDLSAFAIGERASGNEWGAFVNTEFDNGKRFAALAGLRVSGFRAERFNVNLEPRLALRYSITEATSLKASYTRMYQYLHLASLSSASLPTDIWYPSTERTKPQYADQLSVGIANAINDNALFLSFEGYYKWLNNQVEFRDGADVFGNPKLENDFVYGTGSAYGFEAYLEKKKGRTTGWLGYTLSWAWREFDDINDGDAFRPRYDRRHDFSMVFIHKFNDKFSLSGNWIFGSGSWITVPIGRYVFQDQVGDRPDRITPVFSKRGNYQLAPVHRLDLSLVMALKSKRGNQDLTFSLYNAYSRRNPFFIQFREVDNESGVVTGIEPTLVSLFPVLPGITYNFKF